MESTSPPERTVSLPPFLPSSGDWMFSIAVPAKSCSVALAAPAAVLGLRGRAAGVLLALVVVAAAGREAEDGDQGGEREQGLPKRPSHELFPFVW